jgi:hypothetical protein
MQEFAELSRSLVLIAKGILSLGVSGAASPRAKYRSEKVVFGTPDPTRSVVGPTVAS